VNHGKLEGEEISDTSTLYIQAHPPSTSNSNSETTNLEPEPRNPEPKTQNPVKTLIDHGKLEGEEISDTSTLYIQGSRIPWIYQPFTSVSWYI